MVKRAILIHGLSGSPLEGWRPWLKFELEQKGFKVIVPAMPESNHPNVNAWITYLIEQIGTPDEDTYLVGHSLGCITILRYLETLRKDEKIGGAVLVAGFTSDLGIKRIESFFAGPIDWRKIVKHCTKFTAINSDNDPYVSTHYADIFKENLGANVVITHGLKHMSGDDGVSELPAALVAVLKMSEDKSV